MARFLPLLSRYAGSALLLLLLTTVPLQAQEWRQETQLMVVVEENEALEIFLDSLTAALERNPTMRVRRSPQDTSVTSYRSLSNHLLNEEGLALISSTHVFIQYRFVRKNARIVETIEDLHFVYRENPREEDLSILYVRTDRPAIREVLLGSGVPSTVNMQTVTPFRHLLAFPRLVRKAETTVVQMAGQPVRENHKKHRQTLLGYLDGYVKHRGMGYQLSTARTPQEGANMR